MPYWDLVTRSFRIAWKHKYLWLIALFSGEGGGASFNYSQGSTPRRGNAPVPDAATVQQQLTTWISDHAALLVALGVVVFVLTVAFFILAAVCEGATVRASAEHDAERPFGLGPAWRAGVATMWTVVRFRLLLVALALPLLVVFGGFAIVIFVIALHGNYGAVVGLFLVALLLVLVAIPYAVYLSFLDRYGTRALVLEQLAARPSLVRGHRLLRKRLGRSLLVWLISVGVAIGLGIGLACLLAIVFIPLLLIGFAVGSVSQAALIPLIALGVLVLLPLALVVQGFVAAQGSTYWTVAFRRLDVDYPPPAQPVSAPPPALQT